MSVDRPPSLPPFYWHRGEGQEPPDAAAAALGHDGGAAQVARLRRELHRIDAAALQPEGTWWLLVLEQMRDDLL